MGGDTLSDLNITKFDKLIEYLPNVRAASCGPGASCIFIRGLSTDSPGLQITGTAGERVLVTGPSGAVGSAAVQLAKRRGAEVIAMAGDAKADSVRSLGASQVMPRDANLVSLFGQEHFDAAVDIVGGAQFGEILNVLKRGGRYGVSGAISGSVVDLDLRALYLNDLRLIGCTVLEPEVFANFVSYIERGEIWPVVAATYDLSDIVKAQETFLTKKHVGKIVLSL